MRAQGPSEQRRVRQGLVRFRGEERRRNEPGLGERPEEPQRRRHQHERGLLAVPFHLHDHGGAERHGRGRRRAHPRRQVEHGGSCGLRAAEQDRRHWRAVEGGDQDQLVAFRIGECDFRARRWEVFPHPLPRLQADAAAAGLAWRQHQDGHGGELGAGGLQLRRDALDAEIRLSGEEHQEQAADQRGPQGRHDPRVPGGDHASQGRAHDERRRGRAGRRGRRRRAPSAPDREEDRVRRKDRREGRRERGDNKRRRQRGGEGAARGRAARAEREAEA
mmetsp:Transcript_46801/g.142060  ORF Transcript_46801/g.142060 Transcript_46801/m.142060 type:complete len:276 (-) Transcript_46801:1115-1942(-)